jgi:mRNA interferase RelE/StbE
VGYIANKVTKCQRPPLYCINLEGYFKLYADKKRIRIIYEDIDHIIKIIAIDKREDMEVYRIALKRIISMKSRC